MSEDVLEKAARLIVDCWNRGDWPRFRQLAGPGYEYSEVGTGRRVTEVEDVVTAWSRLRQGFPDMSAEVLDVRVDGDETACVLVWRAVQSAPLPGPAGPLAPSYKRIVLGDVVGLGWRDGRLVRECHRHGILSLLAPLLPMRTHLGADPDL